MLQQNAGAFMEVKALDRTRTTVLDTGVFASLDNQVDTQTGTVRAKARFNNAQLALFPSQFVNVQLNVRTIKDAVVVPVAARAPRQHRRLCVRAQGRPHRGAAAGHARPGHGRQGADRHRPAGGRARDHRRRRPAARWLARGAAGRCTGRRPARRGRRGAGAMPLRRRRAARCDAASTPAAAAAAEAAARAAARVPAPVRAHATAAAALPGPGQG